MTTEQAPGQMLLWGSPVDANDEAQLANRIRDALAAVDIRTTRTVVEPCRVQLTVDPASCAGGPYEDSALVAVEWRRGVESGGQLREWRVLVEMPHADGSGSSVAPIQLPPALDVPEAAREAALDIKPPAWRTEAECAVVGIDPEPEDFVPYPGRPWPADASMPLVYVLELLRAEHGDQRYRFDQYRIHGVSNTVLSLVWTGLLADAKGGPVITDAGRVRLAAERAAGRLDGYEDDDQDDDQDDEGGL